jgi:hypothetical protein
MNRTKLILVASILASLAIVSGCRPYNAPQPYLIESNETAFVIPLEGESLKGQGRFESVEFLEKTKVATKRIEVAKRWRQTGRLWFSGEYVETARVIAVSRTPVSRAWQPKLQKDGTLQGGIDVESRDAIGFALGINITAQVLEPNTARFLYWYTGKSLADVIDSNIRADVQVILSEQFSQWDLNDAKLRKNEAFENVRTKIVAKFEEYGITITSFGLAGGLWFEEREIQDAINLAYTAEMLVQRREQEAQAQIFENTRLLSIALNQKEQALAFAEAASARQAQVNAEVAMLQAEALLEGVKKWDGKLPQFVNVGAGGSGTNFLHQLPAASN